VSWSCSGKHIFYTDFTGHGCCKNHAFRLNVTSHKEAFTVCKLKRVKHLRVYIKNDSTWYCKSTFNQFISNAVNQGSTFHQFIFTAVNQGDVIYRLMFPHCKTVVTISIPVWRCFRCFYIET